MLRAHVGPWEVGNGFSHAHSTSENSHPESDSLLPLLCSIANRPDHVNQGLAACHRVELNNAPRHAVILDVKIEEGKKLTNLRQMDFYFRLARYERRHEQCATP